METISNRIIKLVDYLGGNKSEFARKINVTPAYISKLGKNPQQIPSERTIADICRTFNVSYQWLTTGQGEMFTHIADTAVEGLVEAYNLDEDDKKIITSYLALNPEERELLKKVIKSFCE